MVFIWSDSSNQSPNTANEIALAIEFDKTIVPFKITKLTTASTLAYHLLKLNRIDAIPVEETHIKELVRKVLQLLGKTEKSKETRNPSEKQDKVVKVPLFDVVLKSAGGNKLMVVKAVKEMAGFSLLDAKILVDNAPGTLFEGVSSAEAKSAKSILESAGAEVAVVESGGQQNTPLAHKPQPATAKTYKVGDYYDDGKKNGVVFEVTADGKHGKIVSLTESSNKLQWAVDRNFGTLFNRDNPSEKLIGADDKYDGANNMSKVKQIDGWRAKYPAFAWCADLGEGWYLPAKVELRAIYRTRTLFDMKGGDLKSYWSSTEDDQFCALVVDMDGGYTGGSLKDSNHYVRAVSAF
ncbi:MAG: ribosomal protein L7/L12 [Alistipes sp.]|nr:ribosomal protein L7/L12 [Alistipes sp.]